jgi:hypothetical protein
MVELFIISIILFLSCLAVIPWKPKELAIGQHESGGEYPVKKETEIEHALHVMTPEGIATLFGWKKREKSLQKTIPVAEAKISEKPESISWLKPVGFVEVSGNMKFHFFKDERAKRVLKVAEGVPNNGWTIIDVRKNEFILEHEGKSYSVQR